MWETNCPHRVEDVLNSFDASHNILNIFHPCEGTERTTSWIKTFCLRSFYSDKKFLNLGLNRICKTFKHSPLVKEEKITHLFLSDPIPKSLLHPRCETWLMWPWRVKIHATSQSHATSPWVFYRILPNQTRSWNLVQILKLQFFSRLWSYVVDAGTKQNPYCWFRNKAKTMSLCKNKTILKQYIICHDLKLKYGQDLKLNFAQAQA